VTLIVWLRVLLITHTSYLLTVPAVTQSLSALYQTLAGQSKMFKKLLNLNGRLSLMMAQLSVNKEDEVNLNRGPLRIYQEDDDDDDDNDDDVDYEDEDGDEDDEDETHEEGNGVDNYEEEGLDDGEGEGEDDDGEEDEDEDEDEMEE